MQNKVSYYYPSLLCSFFHSAASPILNVIRQAVYHRMSATSTYSRPPHISSRCMHCRPLTNFNNYYCINTITTKYKTIATYIQKIATTEHLYIAWVLHVKQNIYTDGKKIITNYIDTLATILKCSAETYRPSIFISVNWFLYCNSLSTILLYFHCFLSIYGYLLSFVLPYFL